MATYVQISRDEFEDWLKRSGYKWERDTSKAGIYLLPLSDNVAIKVSSTIGSRDDAMGRGQASIKLSLMSTVTGYTLNKKAQGQAHFKRTTNWEKTLKKGLDRMKQAYLKAASFYDIIAGIKDRKQYEEDILKKIESVPDWRDSDMLASFYQRVESHGVLTEKQMNALDKIVEGKESPQEQQGPDEGFLNRMRQLYREADRDGNDWLKDFVKSVAEQYKRRGSLSDKQLAVLDKNFKRYRVATNHDIVGELRSIADLLRV